MPARPDRGAKASVGRGIQTQAEWFGELARDAWERGQTAIDRGDLNDGIRWLERAHRIAPDDLTVTLSLAATLLRVRDPCAGDLFERVARASDQREAWIGLAAARFAQGEMQAAADAAREAISRHGIADDKVIENLLTNIAAAVHAPGWLGVRPMNALRVQTGEPRRVVFSADGRVRSLSDGAALDSRWNSLSATLDGTHLLGSPIPLDHMRRLTGVVAAHEGGLRGWAWSPATPELPVMLRVRSMQGDREIPIIADGEPPPGMPPTERGRSFEVAAGQLVGMNGLLRVVGPNGQDLLGSPVDAGAEIEAAGILAASLSARFSAGGASRSIEGIPAQAAVRAAVMGRSASAKLAPSRRIVVVIPVHRNEKLTVNCLDALERTMPAGTRIIVIDDATPEPVLARTLDQRARQRRIQLIRNAENKGFPASANIGMRAALALPGKRDVLLLNSDAVVTEGALECLRAATQGAPDIGTATPFSNDATLVSYPKRSGGNAVPTPHDLRKMASIARRAGQSQVVDIPTAVGFCMYIRRECLTETGLFREDVFAQGYGEENDFCIRARHLGWRSVAVPSAYVAHVGGQSFGAARAHLITRNLDVLERLHPGYHALIASFDERDPLAAVRRRLDRIRFAGAQKAKRAVVIVTHDSGGGVERMIQERCRQLRCDGVRPVVLRPVIDRGDAATPDRRYAPGLCGVSDGMEADYPNLVFHLPDELPALLALLRRTKPSGIELHHLLGHHPAVLRLPALLGIKPDIHVHDYAWFCPRISLIGGERRYCGEPMDVAVCEACVADLGSNLEEDIGIAALRERSSGILASARSVVTPSADTSIRFRRHFPSCRILVHPHEDDRAISRPLLRAAPVRRVAVIGGIGIEKGYDVLLACARDAASRALPLEFVVVGHTIDDRRLFDTRRVSVTGPYQDDEIIELIRSQNAQIAFLPSIWPETWCLTLGHAWRAGLFVAAFDIGAQAERIRRTGFGWLFPLGLPAGRINNALLAAEAPAGDECAATPRGR